MSTAQQIQFSRIRGKARRVVAAANRFPESSVVRGLPPEAIRRLAAMEPGWADDVEAFFEVLTLAGWAGPGDREAIESLFHQVENALLATQARGGNRRYYAQQVRRDELPGAGGGVDGKRPAWATLLPAMLRPAGYRSYHSGKWHVDGPVLAGGFDHSWD